MWLLIYVLSYHLILLSWWIRYYTLFLWLLLECRWRHFIHNWCTHHLYTLTVQTGSSNFGVMVATAKVVSARWFVIVILGSSFSAFPFISETTWSLTFAVLLISVFGLMTSLRRLRVESCWCLLNYVWAVCLIFRRWVLRGPMSFTKHFGVVLILGKFILVLVHYLLNWVLSSIASTTLPAQVIHWVTTSTVILRVRLHLASL